MSRPFEFVESVKTIIITTINPCSSIANTESDDEIDNLNWYGLVCDSVSWETAPDPDRTEVALLQYDGVTSPSWSGADLTDRVLIALDGDAMGRCFTITGNTTDTIYLEERHDWHATDRPYGVKEGDHYTIVHSAKSMYNYCVANSKQCVALATNSYNWNNASPEKPKSYSAHITPRIGTGKFSQSVSLGECEIWYSDPRFREFMLSKFNELLFKWHKIRTNDASYLIITTQFYDTLTGETWFQNRNFFKESAVDEDFDGRGYLKGFPLGSSGKTDYTSTFSIPFEEAWD